MSTKEGKIMIIENLIQESQGSARVIAAPARLNEVVHDLKNCMSILLYWVETLETDADDSDPHRPHRSG
jgi:hypothetical protein